MKEGINWCKNTITKDFPNFHFKLTELKNDLYNSKKESAENFKFPYSNKTFDVAFLFSVFTHMQPYAIQNYLNEINRTLKDDGRCLATFFIYNDSNESQISNVNRDFNFKYSYDGYRLMDDKVKSANIAFHEKKLNEMLIITNLIVSKRVNGFWIDKMSYEFLFVSKQLFSKSSATVFARISPGFSYQINNRATCFFNTELKKLLYR